MFEIPATRTALPLLLLKKLCLIVIGGYLAMGLAAGYRAYHQVKSVDLDAPRIIRAGTSIETSVVTYGRTFLDLRVELIQGQRSEILSTHRIAKNGWGLMDPRTRRVPQSIVLTKNALMEFQPGPAILRATVTGLPQLGHVPPPVVSEAVVEIQRN